MAATLILVAYVAVVVALWLITIFAQPSRSDAGATATLLGRTLDALAHCAVFAAIYALTHDWRVLILTYLFGSKLEFRVKS